MPKKNVPIKYTSRSFETIKNDLVEHAKRYYPTTFKDFNESGFGSLMLDSVSYIGDVLSFYLDFQANETFIQNAAEFDNILKLAKQSGYKHRNNPSSNTVASAAATGSGCGPNSINYVLGITKAYTTRVGAGPFPTELKDKIGQELGTKGKEFGTVTSRQRRCGWFDGILVRQSIKISGINGIALTKLDVLDELEEIKMCIAYELEGKKIDYLPSALDEQLKLKPIYKTFKGWKTSTNGIKKFDDLPDNAKNYINELEKFIEAKVCSISTSPERNDTILIENPFKI